MRSRRRPDLCVEVILDPARGNPNAVAQADSRRPAKLPQRERIVENADRHVVWARRQVMALDRPAESLLDQVDKADKARSVTGTYVENLFGSGIVKCQRKRIGNVADIDIVAYDAAVAPDFDWQSSQCAMQEDAHGALCRFNALTFAKRVGDT